MDDKNFKNINPINKKKFPKYKIFEISSYLTSDSTCPVISSPPKSVMFFGKTKS